MDTRSEYIKMCQKATEIQVLRPEGREFEFGDYFIVPERGKDPFIAQWVEADDEEGGDYIWCRDPSYIWLPRQDQLQEIFTGPNSGLKAHQIVNMIDMVVNQIGDGSYYTQFVSLEQLLLAFVMNQKYRKLWSGEDWVNA